MMTDTETSTSKKTTRLPVEGQLGTQATFDFDPADLVIDGLDNDVEIDVYNKSRIQEKLLDEDIMSIVRHGVRKIIEVWLEKDEDRGVRVGHVGEGRQRVRRCRVANEWIDNHNAGKKILPEFEGQVLDRRTVRACVVKRATGTEEILRSVAANSGTLIDSPKRLALVANYLHGMGAEPKEIALALGKNDETVRGYLALKNASSKLMKALDTGLIGVTAASRLAEMTKDEQNAALEQHEAESPGKVITKEKATVEAKKGKAAAKGKETAQETQRMSLRDLRKLQAGLVADAPTDKVGLAMLTVVNLVLGEKAPAGGGEYAKQIRLAMG